MAKRALKLAGFLDDLLAFVSSQRSHFDGEKDELMGYWHIISKIVGVSEMGGIRPKRAILFSE